MFSYTIFFKIGFFIFLFFLLLKMIINKKLFKALSVYIIMTFLIRYSILLIPKYDECDATCETSADINSYNPVNNEKFLTYLPHSQFHNQLVELKNAFVLAYLTNRTLIIPPI